MVRMFDDRGRFSVSIHALQKPVGLQLRLRTAGGYGCPMDHNDK